MPTPLEEWAIAQFGAHDKTVLVGSVLVGVLLLAAVAGLLARRRFAYGAGLLAVLVAIPAAAVLTRPCAGIGDVLPSLVAGAAGVAALAWLTGARAAPATGDEGDVPTRRGVLVAAGTPPTAGSLDARVPGISPFRNPTDRFYRIDTLLSLPVVHLDDWTLTIDGDVEREVKLTFDDLAAMPLIERDILLTCVSNEVGGSYVGAARWRGVRLTDVLAEAGIGATGADQILSTDLDGMTISTPLELATDGRDAMIAIGMNGRSLPQQHGFPARMIVPGLYGFISACKWISRMTLTTYAEQDAYWTQRAGRPTLRSRRPAGSTRPRRSPPCSPAGP